MIIFINYSTDLSFMSTRNILHTVHLNCYNSCKSYKLLSIWNFVKWRKLITDKIWWISAYIIDNTSLVLNALFIGGRRGRDRMVVGVTTSNTISGYHHWCCEFESPSARGVKHYVIKIVNILPQVPSFLRVLRFPPPIKLTATI